MDKEQIELIKILGDSPDNQKAVEKESNTDFQKVMRGIRRHLFLILVMGGLGSAAAVFTVHMLNKSYTATTYLLYQQEMPETIGKSYTLSRLTLPTVIEMMSMPQHLKTMKSILGLDLTHRKLKKMIMVDSPAISSDLIRVTVKGENSNLVMDIANAYSNVVVKHSQDFNRTQLQSAYDYFNTQLNIDRERYAKQSAQLLEFKKKYPFFELKNGASTMITKAAEAKSRYQSALLRYNTMLVEYENLRRESSKMPDRIVKYGYEDSSTKDRIAQAEMALLNARTKYSSENPKVKILESSLSELRNMVSDSSQQETKSEVYAKNPVKEGLDQELMRMRGKLRSAQKLKEDLGKILTQSQEEFSKLPADQSEYVKIEHRNKSLEDEITALEEALNSTELFLRLGEGNVQVYQGAEAAEKTVFGLDEYEQFLPIIGFVLGLGFGIFLSICLEMMDPKVCTVKQLEALSPIPCWLQIPEITKFAKKDAEQETLYYIRNLSGYIDLQEKNNKKTKVIAFTSSLVGEGKSCLAYHTALYYQKRLNKKVLYVSFDSTLNSFFQKTEEPPKSFNEYLQGKAPLNKTVYTGKIDLVKVNDESNLNELVKSAKMEEALEHFKTTYDLVIFDLPAVSENECAYTLASFASTHLFVIGSSKVKKEYIEQALSELKKRCVEPHGLILNQIENVYVSDVRVSLYKKKLKKETPTAQVEKSDQTHTPDTSFFG